MFAGRERRKRGGAGPAPLFRRAKLRGGGASIYSAGEDAVHNELVHRWRGEGL